GRRREGQGGAEQGQRQRESSAHELDSFGAGRLASHRPASDRRVNTAMNVNTANTYSGGAREYDVLKTDNATNPSDTIEADPFSTFNWTGHAWTPNYSNSNYYLTP